MTWIINVFKYISLDEFCILKDNGLSDNIISYNKYFNIRNIKIIRNKNNKIVIKINKKLIPLQNIFKLQHCTLFIYIIENYIDEFPLNIFINYNWSIKKINKAFKSKKIFYLFNNGKKIIKINSIKSAINRYNYPALLKLIHIGIKPTLIDLKVAKYINIKQITNLIKSNYI